jgi:hypothetical protein
VLGLLLAGPAELPYAEDALSRLGGLQLFPTPLADRFIALLPGARCDVLPGEQLLLTVLLGLLVWLRVVSVAALEPALPCANTAAGTSAIAAAASIGWILMRVSSFRERRATNCICDRCCRLARKRFGFSALSFDASREQVGQLG